MCAQLGLPSTPPSVSRAKGCIERLWATLQSFLISEMRIRGIATIEEANAYLPEFTAGHNRRFAPKESAFAPAPPPREIDFHLCPSTR